MDVLFVDILNDMFSDETRSLIAQNLKDWLSKEARLKPLPDLQERIRKMGEKFDILAQSVTFEKRDAEVVVKASGDGEATLKMLENGTDWFDPCDNVVNVMISALWKS